MNQWHLLLTRPLEAAQKMACSLAQAGIAISYFPLSVIQPFAHTAGKTYLRAELNTYDAIIVTSQNAAQILIKKLSTQYKTSTGSPLWIAVGPTTGSLLLAAGIPVCWPEDHQDSEGILALAPLTKLLSEKSARILIVKGTNGRPWLGERLQEQKAHVVELCVYQNHFLPYQADSLYKTIVEKKINSILISSGQAFEHLYQLSGAHWPSIAQQIFFVPSQRVAHLLQERGALQVIDCQGATAAALIRSIHHASLKPPQ